MALNNPPPRNARLTKKLALEVLSVLNEIEYNVFSPRILDRPANGIKWEWLRDIQDRVCAIRAHLNQWKDNCKTHKRRKGGAK